MPARQRRGSRTNQNDVEIARIRAQSLSRVWDVIVLLIRCGFWIGIGIIALRAVQAVAGKETNVQVLLDLAANIAASKWAYMLIALLLLGGGAAVRERANRKTIANQSKHIRRLESQEHPDREPSGLPDDQNGSPKGRKKR